MVQESGTRKSQAPVVAIHCASLPSVAPLRVGKRMVEWSVIWSIHVLVLVHGTMWCGSAAASLHSRLSASGGADGEHMPVLVHRMGARCRLFTRQAAASCELRLWWCYFPWRSGFGPLGAEPAYDQPKKEAEDEQAYSQPCDLAVSVATRRLNAVAAFIRRRR